MVYDLGFHPRPWQAECFRRFKRFSVVVVHRRGGKTVMAIMRLVDAALRCDKPAGRYGYIAPLLGQAKGIAWDYLKAYARKVPGTHINEAELWVQFANGARIRIYGADNPDNLRGLYFDGVVVDEVAQIKLELWEGVLQPTLSDRLGWALFIGTPKGINLFSQLYYKALADSTWYASSYNCEVTGAIEAGELAQLQAQTAGPIWRQEYLCDFSASSDNALITIDDVLSACARHLRITEYNFAPKILGVDVAWQGGDRSVIFPRQGRAAFRPKIERGLPEKSFAAVVAKAIADFKPAAVFVDTTGGYGGEVVSRLEDTGHVITPVVFSWKASDERFQNIRAEMWFKMAAWVKEGGALPPSTDLQSELCAPTYTNDNASNRLKLESKDDIRGRLGMSPDLADALALTFAFPVAIPAPGQQHVLHDADPYQIPMAASGSVTYDGNPFA